MLNNQKISELHQSVLRNSHYEAQVIMFDKNCTGCPHARYKVEELSTDDFEIARKVAIENKCARIIRSCNFNNEHITLQEIVSNTCKFWGDTEHDEGIFIEVNSVEELDICLQPQSL